MPDSLVGAVTAIVVALVAAAGTGPAGRLDLPPVDLLAVVTAPSSSVQVPIRDQSGQTIGTYVGQGMDAASQSGVPDVFRRAIVAVEDRRLGRHVGVDAVAVLAALLSGAAGQPRGGSTLSQQLVKNKITGGEVSVRRKLVESILSVRLTRSLPREALLDAYIGGVWFGRGVTGAGASAVAWFGRGWRDLTLGEIAFLAGLPQGAGRFERSGPADVLQQGVLARRNAVLAAMERAGLISADAAAGARSEPLRVVPANARPHGDAWVERAVSREMRSRSAVRHALAAPGAGLVSTINPDLQLILRSAVQAWAGTRPMGPAGHIGMPAADGPLSPDVVDRLRDASARVVRPSKERGRAILLGPAVEAGQKAWRVLVLRDGAAAQEVALAAEDVPGDVPAAAGQVYPCTFEDRSCRLYPVSQEEIAVVAMEARTGRILATVGGSAPDVSAFDRTVASRQPGSAIKPFLWLAALEQGLRATDLIGRQARSYRLPDGRIWRPQDFGEEPAGGTISLEDGLVRSSNLAALALAERIGLARFAQVSAVVGISDQAILRTELSSSLGSFQTTLVRLVGAYAALANGGHPVVPHLVAGLQQGTAVSLASPPMRPAIAPGPILAEVGRMLRGVVTRGTAAGAMAGAPVAIAGKTGTTDGHRDAWFVGFTPDIVIGAWIGRDDGAPISDRMTGGAGPARVVRDILDAAHHAGLLDAGGRLAPPTPGG